MSDLESSSSGSETDSDAPSTFKKKITFRQQRKNIDQIDTDANTNTSSTQRNEQVALSNINRNLQLLEQQNLERESQNSLVFDERVLCKNIDDTDGDSNSNNNLEDDVEYQNWKRRELDRLHRDRNMRIEREKDMGI